MLYIFGFILVVFMTVVTYFYIVVDTQRGCHTLKKFKK